MKLGGAAQSSMPATQLDDSVLRQAWDVLQALISDRAHNPHGLFSLAVSADDVPMYYKVIRQPMDLNTVRARLEDGKYSTVEEFAADVRLVFNNAMEFNPPQDFVHLSAKHLLQEFETKLVTTSSVGGECCDGKTCTVCKQQCKTLTHPSLLTCSHCQAKIHAECEYYRVGNDRGQHWCLQCYSALPEEFIGIVGQRLKKHVLDLCSNSCSKHEDWKQCSNCQAWMHEICSMGEPTCSCTAKQARDASELPQSELGEFIQRRIRACAEQELTRAPPSPGHALLRPELSLPKAKELADTLVCRELCRFNCTAPVLEGARLKRFIRFQQPSSSRSSRDCEFTTRRERAIAVFQYNILCFVLYVQEYSSSVYISYLDSCAYMEPRRLRSVVYQECLVAYFAWVHTTQESIQRVYLWASPPEEGDGYVFNVRPFWQRNPTPERLKKWYAGIYKTCRKQGIFKSESTLYDMHLAAYKPVVRTRQRIASGYIPTPPKPALALDTFPFFAGDFCQATLETILCKLESNVADVGDELEMRVQKWWKLVWGDCAKIGVKTMDNGEAQYLILPSVERDLSEQELAQLELDTCTCFDRDEWLMRKLADAVRPQKDAFLVYEFNRKRHTAKQACVEEEEMPTTIFNNRLDMLDYLHRNHLQFDTKLRAQYSSKILLQSLFSGF